MRKFIREGFWGWTLWNRILPYYDLKINDFFFRIWNKLFFFKPVVIRLIEIFIYLLVPTKNPEK